MIVDNVKIRNFLAISEAEFSLNEQGLCLIQGVNETNPAAKSNGAGKSSLTDAICWALFGTTARGEAGDSVIRFGEKDCEVKLSLLLDEGTLYVTRQRSKGKTKLTLWLVDMGGTIDISKGTEKLTQACLEDMIGCSYEVFKSAVYLGQEQMPDIPLMTDRNLKQLVEEAAGIGIIEKAYEAAVLRHKMMLDQFKAFDKAKYAYETELGAAEANLASLTTQEASYRAEWHDDVLRLTQGYQAKADEWAKFKATWLLKLGLSAGHWHEVRSLLESNRRIHDAYEDKLESLFKAQRAGSHLNDRRSDLLKAVHVRESEISKVQSAIDVATTRLAEMTDDKPCVYCGSSVTRATPDEINAQRAVIKLHESHLSVAYAAMAEQAKELADVEAELKTLADVSKEITDVRAMMYAQADICETLETILRAEAAVATETERAQKILENKTNEKSPYEPLIKKAADFVAAVKAKLAPVIEEMAAVEKDLAVAADVVRVFSPKGVRAHILDQVTPFLNERTSAYLDVLSDGMLKAEWTTLVPDAKGELKEKFSITVSHPAGEGFKGLSGGEKRKIRIACALALQDLVAGRASKPFRLFIGDEIDDALDSAGLERLMVVLNEKAKERGTVLVISHRDLSDWIPNVWTVKNNSGSAILEGVI